jgi:predicted ATPase/class 3 adenylate cyclase
VDVAAWLRGLGLGRYEQVFRDNGVDPEVLPHLTADDLRDMGVTAIGHRRKLLQAIGMLRRAPDGPPEAPTSPHAAASARPPEPTAERRQLTVMFVDLVGSTALAGRLDPEDMGAVIRAYQDACAGVITRFEGHVAKFMGDGVLAYFGYPQAHEDAAERAVRAGLGVIEAVARLAAPDPAGTPLAARVGVATGLVVVGEMIGRGEAQERAVVGETPNLAARLQALAEPSSVVIGPTTWRLVGGLFELADLGAHDLKGFAAPVRAWRVLGPGAAQGRFEARQAAGLTPLVGREAELALLLGRWERAKDGEGQVALLSGEPGIGKSRLTQALRERLGGETYTSLRYQCSPYHVSSALHPVIDQLERAADFQRDDTDETKLAKLEAVLADTAASVAQAAPLLASLLSLPTAGRYPPLGLSPQRQKARTLEVLVAHLAGLAAVGPVLVVLEDAHWIDPSTEELFGLVVERARDLPVFMVVTFRPEFQPPWLGHAHVSLLTINRLGRRQGGAMVERVAGKALPAEIADQIVAKTDGVPLFVEELTKTVLESGLLREEGGRYELAGPLPALAIPATLHDSLMARLERLAPMKEVAQIGAALGREFSYELLAAVAPLQDGELQDALGQLVEAELVFRRGTPPAASYVFKHALVQDAAYQSLLRSKRQRLHARIALVVEERFPEMTEAQPEVLAQHCAEAGLIEKAVHYWHRAAQLAVRRSAMAEAVAQVRNGLELLSALPNGPTRARQELDLQVTLGHALMALKGVAAPEMGAAYARARELCRACGGGDLEPIALYGMWQFLQNRADMAASGETAEELLRWAKARDDVAAEVEAHRSIGSTCLFRAEFNLALEHFERVRALYAPAQGYAARNPLDPRVGATSLMPWALLLQGHPDRALARSREALAAAEAQARPYMLAVVMHQQNVFDQLRGDRRAVEERAAALMAITAEHGFAHWHATATLLHGWAVGAGGAVEDGIAEMRRGLAAKEATGARLKIPFYLGLMAGLHGRAGRGTEALHLIGDALARVETTGERWFETELHRLRGESLLRARVPDADEAEACFVRAIDGARTQRAKWWELRAALSLARVWRDRGKRAEARDLLAPVYGWFSEGFDTLDLQEAKALLEALR